MVTGGGYIPDRGDFVWIDFDPQVGHEQSGRRPALVISPLPYNRRTGLALFCPVTSRVKGFPWEVAIPAGMRVTGVVLADQVKNLAWRERRTEFVETAGPDVVDEAIEKLSILVLFS
jgi:mRNA interferase MazF